MLFKKERYVMWLVYAIGATLLWGCADLFYKKGADEHDKYSHLKISVFVGLAMGIHAIITLIVSDISYNPINMLIYLPVSLMYIISMIVGYCGLKYLELSISSPIQNSSGAFSCILLLVFLGEMMDLPTVIAVVMICAGVLLIGIFEKTEGEKIEKTDENKKYVSGAVAILFPIAYCVIDSLGTFFDGWYLDDIATTPLVGVTEANFEDVANISYELTFLTAAVILFVFIKFIKRQSFGFERIQGDRVVAAVLETLGQWVYVYAMAANAVVSAPVIGSYCFVSVLLSRIFLKEKLSKKKYAAIALIILGIVILGILEGMEEA